MLDGSSPLVAIRRVRDDVVAADGFPPPGVRAIVSQAIEELKAASASAAHVAVAEQLSVCLFRLEMASWGNTAPDFARIREAIAALDSPNVESIPAAEAA